MATLQSSRGLSVWQQRMTLVEDVYKASETLPKHQPFTLVSHLQKTAISIPSNIAEGYARSYRKEYLQHISITYGSLAELETQLEITHRLRSISQEAYKPLNQQLSILGKELVSLRLALSKPTDSDCTAHPEP